MTKGLKLQPKPIISLHFPNIRLDKIKHLKTMMMNNLPDIPVIVTKHFKDGIMIPEHNQHGVVFMGKKMLMLIQLKLSKQKLCPKSLKKVYSKILTLWKLFKEMIWWRIMPIATHMKTPRAYSITWNIMTNLWLKNPHQPYRA